MCVHNVDGQRGWTGECPDSGHCLCGFFPEVGPAFPQPRPASTTSTARTVVHIVLGVVGVLLALVTLGALFIELSSDELRDDRRRRALS
jgi:hypothetical protein